MTHTVSSLTPAAVHLTGKLIIRRHPRLGRPRLAIRVWLPEARGHCEFPVGDQYHPSHAIRAEVASLDGEIAPVAVGIDPGSVRQARETLRHFAGWLRAWTADGGRPET